MNNKNTDIDKIDRYIQGLSSDKEKSEIQKRMAEDKEFRNLFDDIEIMTEGFRRSGASSTLEEKLELLEKTLNEEDEDNPEEEEKDPKIIIFWYQQPFVRAIAAGIALVAVAWFALGPLGSVSNQELFAENFSPYPNTYGSTRA